MRTSPGLSESLNKMKTWHIWYMVSMQGSGTRLKKLATTDTQIGQITNIQYTGIYHFIVLQSAKLADIL